MKPEAETNEKVKAETRNGNQTEKNVGKAKSLDGGSHPEVSILELPSMFLQNKKEKLFHETCHEKTSTERCLV